MVFRALRKHINPATILALVALVFAVTGGAFAATGGSGAGGSSHATPVASVAKAKAKKKSAPAGKAGPAGPKGATGATGPQGPAGPTGAPGAAGAKGENGAAGTPGSDGTNGTDGVNGKSVVSSQASGSECKEGVGGTKFEVEGSGTSSHVCNGKPGTFGGESLPKGKTLTGVWAASGYAEAAVPNPGYGIAYTGISFALPTSEPTVHYIASGETVPSGCSGDLDEPGAAEGNLCVFGSTEDNLAGAPGVSVEGSSETSLGFTLSGYSKAKGAISMSGTWAVTGE